MLSQAVTTIVYLVNGIFVYAFVGDSEWLRSPISFRLSDGTGKTVSHAFLVFSFGAAAIVDATIFVRLVKAVLQPAAARLFGSRDSTPDTYFDQPASDLEKNEEPPAPESGITCAAWWFLWTAVTMAFAALTAAAVGALNDVIGIAASVIACQTSVSWPGVLSYRLQERSAKRMEECYYHGSGTAPCRCSRAHALRSPRFLLLVVGCFLALVGIYSNAVDLRAHWKRGSSFKLFQCRSADLFSQQKGRRGGKIFSIP